MLFSYLLYRYHRDREEIISINPAVLMSLIVGFSVAALKAASEELRDRGYIEYTPADEKCTSGKYRIVKTLKEKKRKR